MYSEAVQTLAEQSAAKLAMQRRSLPAHLVRSMLAGMYVGAAIALSHDLSQRRRVAGDADAVAFYQELSDAKRDALRLVPGMRRGKS